MFTPTRAFRGGIRFNKYVLTHGHLVTEQKTIYAFTITLSKSLFILWAGGLNPPGYPDNQSHHEAGK